MCGEQNIFILHRGTKVPLGNVDNTAIRTVLQVKSSFLRTFGRMHKIGGLKMSELYNRIEDKAREKGLTVGGLCDLSGVYQSRLADLKNGRTKHLSESIIRKLANTLGTTPEDLLYGANSRRILHVDLDNDRLDFRLICESMNTSQLLSLLNAVTKELNARSNSQSWNRK
jgi:transcriptional regulator with XRE-family HTH domain